MPNLEEAEAAQCQLIYKRTTISWLESDRKFCQVQLYMTGFLNWHSVSCLFRRGVYSKKMSINATSKSLHLFFLKSLLSVLETHWTNKSKINDWFEVSAYLTKFWLQFVKYCSLEVSTASFCFLSTILLRWGILRRRNSFGKNMMSPARWTDGTLNENE